MNDPILDMLNHVNNLIISHVKNPENFNKFLEWVESFEAPVLDNLYRHMTHSTAINKMLISDAHSTGLLLKELTQCCSPISTSDYSVDYWMFYLQDTSVQDVATKQLRAYLQLST